MLSFNTRNFVLKFAYLGARITPDIFQYYAQRNRRTPNWKRLRAHFRGLFGRPEAKWKSSKLWNMTQEKRTFQNWNENSDRGFFPQARQENLNFPRMS